MAITYPITIEQKKAGQRAIGELAGMVRKHLTPKTMAKRQGELLASVINTTGMSYEQGCMLQGALVHVWASPSLIKAPAEVNQACYDAFMVNHHFVKYFVTKPDGSRFGSLLLPYKAEVEALIKRVGAKKVEALTRGEKLTFKHQGDEVEVELWLESHVIKQFGSLDAAPISES